MGKVFLLIGILFILVGGLLSLLEGLGLGKLPFDIVVKAGNLRVYIPLGTALLISVVLTLLINILVILLKRL